MSTKQSAVEKAPFDAMERREQLGQRAAGLLERGLKAGGDEIEAITVYRESISVNFEHGDLKLTQVDESSGSGLRVMKSGRMGFAATNQSTPAALDGLAKDALEIAAISPPDEHNVLSEAGAEVRECGPIDTALSGWSVEQATDAARDMVARAHAVDPRISLDNASLSLTRAAFCVANSKGISATEAEASINLSLFGMAIDGDDVGGFDYWGDRTRQLSGLQAIMESSVERFTRAALGNLAAGAAESYKGKVLFSPAAFAEIFVSPVVSAASSIAVQRGRSAFAKKLGTQVADTSLSIIDDPTDLALGGNCTFDREGIAAQQFSILEEGVLQGWLYNGYSAHVDGVRSTGHAAGGTRAAPGLGPHSIVVPGSGGGDEVALMRALGKGLVVQRFSGTVDPASGDFSGVAKSARWVEGGEIVRGVRETLISGNAFELMKEIDALSSKSESIMGSMRAPWALIDGLSVTAG